MPRKTKIEEKLEHLREACEAGLGAEGESLLRDALRSSNRELVAAATRMACARGMEQLCEDMAIALHRFIANPKKDKGCIAKCALAEALDALEYEDDEVFFSGLAHRQLEPVWGGREDTAAALRAKCAFALVRRNTPDILFRLADLLQDSETEARQAAIRAIAFTGGNEAELMLRVLAGQGARAEDVAECLTGLMQCNPERSLAFVARFLDHDTPVVAESAAIALGTSRQEEAFKVLERQWEKTVVSESRQMLLLPIALVRSEEALAFLLSVLREGSLAAAEATLEALTIYRQDCAARDAIHAAVRERGSARLMAEYARHFGED